MPGNEFAPEKTSELAEANRRGDPYLVYRDAHERQCVLSLSDTWERITIGRGMSADVALTWDQDASRVHAELVRLADDWTVTDDGLSRNGTFVNDRRVEGRLRLMDGDFLRCGGRSCCSFLRSRPRSRRGPADAPVTAGEPHAAPRFRN